MSKIKIDFRKAALPVLLFAFVICSFLVGISFGVTCLQDPDTCWGLNMGKVIIRNRSIPSEDPFSTNAKSIDGKPHVYYQWLSEVALGGAYNLGRLFSTRAADTIPYEKIARMSLEERSQIWQGPLDGDDALKVPMALGALLTTGAFLVFPLLFFLRAPKRFLSVPILILVATQASSFHFYLRSELFSAFMFSLELLILNSLRLAILADSNYRVSFWSIIQICALFVLWCNLHCGFVLGLVVLFVFALSQTLILSSFESKRKIWLIFALGTLCTLINPWGFELWIYLLKLFTSPVGASVEELQPLSFFELFSHTYSLYFIFACAQLGLLIFALLKAKSNDAKSTLLCTLILVAMVLVMGIGARRLIPFACIVAVFEWAFMMSIIFRNSKPEEWDLSLQYKRSKILAPVLVCLVFGFSIFGTWWEAGLFRLRLPQGSFGFPPPYEAIRYLQYANSNKAESGKISGQVLNDPQFGNMMIYYLGTSSRVFIDTRFDIYSDKTVFDFLRMANCQSGWERLLDSYKISWIFLPQHTQLATFARNHPEKWITVYCDDSALISRRKDF